MKRLLYLSLLGVLVIMGMLAVVSCGGSTATTKPGGGLQTAPPPGQTTGPDFKPFAVTIKNLDYSPASVEVAIGTTVTWTNEDSVTHTVTSRTGIFDSGNMSKGSNFSHTFSEAGDYEYYCIPHPFMVGHVIVK